MIDPEVKFKKAMAQIQAEVIRDLSDSVIIPFKLDDYIQELTHAVNRLVNNGLIFTNETDMKKESDGLLFGLSNITAAAGRLNDDIKNVDYSNPLAVRIINDKLMSFEKSFIDINGLPERPRYKHILHSPSGGNYYGGIDFPGLEDLIYRYNKDHATETWEEIKKHLATITYCLYAAAKSLS